MKIEDRRCSVCQNQLDTEQINGVTYVNCHCSNGAGYSLKSAMDGWEESNREAVALYEKLFLRGPYWGS